MSEWFCLNLKRRSSPATVSGPRRLEHVSRQWLAWQLRLRLRSNVGQVIDGSRQPAGSLDEQFEPLILEGIGMDANGAKSCTDIFAGLCRLEPREGQGKAEP